MRTLAVCRRELAATFESPIAYVTIALFVITLDGLFFFIGYPIGSVPLPSLWTGAQASLVVLFTWLPLLLALLVPALTMGAWAEERSRGTEELLLTYPVRTGEVVMGKFLASWTLVALPSRCQESSATNGASGANMRQTRSSANVCVAFRRRFEATDFLVSFVMLIKDAIAAW